MKFFDTEVSRMVLGVNPFCGYAHYNNNFSGAMKDWYTPERVCAVMHELRATALTPSTMWLWSDCRRTGFVSSPKAANAPDYAGLER